MGGAGTDTEGRTTVAGLYAAGEVTCTGGHGANRLASNSLLEGLVFGARAGAAALADPRPDFRPGREAEPVAISPSDWTLDPRTRRLVQEVMWQRVGLIRRGADLESAIEELGRLAEEAVNLRTQNYATLARLMARAALWREESRGGHYRADFPERDDARWRVHSSQRQGHPIAPLPTVSRV